MQSPLESQATDAAVSIPASRSGLWSLRWLPLAATSAQVIPCFFFLSLSGLRVAFGTIAVFSAAIAGPFEFFHQNKLRVPFFVIAGGLSLLNLYLYAHAKRLRPRPAAQWRIQPLSAREHRIQRIQLVTSLLTLAMIAGDVLNHKLHGLGF
jgi:hypothetical protein